AALSACSPLPLHDALPILQVLRTSPTIKLAIDTTNFDGRSHRVTFVVEDETAAAPGGGDPSGEGPGDSPDLSKDPIAIVTPGTRSEEHTSELQSRENLVCR